MLVLLEVIARLWVTVAVAVIHIASLLTLTLYSKVELVSTILLGSIVPVLHYMLQVVQTILEPCIVVSDTGIVVSRSTICIELRTIAILDDILAAILQAIDSTGIQVECHLEVAAMDVGTLSRLIYRKLHRLTVLGNSSDRRSSHISALHSQLLFHLRISLGSPRHILAQKELNGYEVLALWIEACIIVWQGIEAFFARTHDILGTLQWLIL